MFISGGSFSGTYIVMAKTQDKKVSAFIVPGDAKGISFGKK
jgi:alkylation response protein AidB-like acyl-CoA dehydrogenase